ncbi:hypothetical protein WG66_004472 [Moniliophthora roreri]|nr:hypothetical protein WG66_004472 [Moniliophthora roreri]
MTNISSTAAVGYKVERLQRKFVGQYIREEQTQARPQKILALILETGVVYSSLWVAGGVVTVNAALGSDTLGGDVMGLAGRGVVNIYPTVLVVVILLHKSLWDLSGQVQVSTIEFRTSETV